MVVEEVYLVKDVGKGIYNIKLPSETWRYQNRVVYEGKCKHKWIHGTIILGNGSGDKDTGQW